MRNHVVRNRLYKAEEMRFIRYAYGTLFTIVRYVGWQLEFLLTSANPASGNPSPSLAALAYSALYPVRTHSGGKSKQLFHYNIGFIRFLYFRQLSVVVDPNMFGFEKCGVSWLYYALDRKTATYIYVHVHTLTE